MSHCTLLKISLASVSIFSRMGFHHVGQAGLELWASSDPFNSASQSAHLYFKKRKNEEGAKRGWERHESMTEV